MSAEPNNPGRTRLVWLMLGILAFGLLMGCREELPQRWQRSLTAGMAAAVLAAAVLHYRGTRCFQKRP